MVCFIIVTYKSYGIYVFSAFVYKSMIFYSTIAYFGKKM